MLSRKEAKLEWALDCEEAFESLKKTIVISLTLTRPLQGETLYIYLKVAEEAMSVILIRDPKSNKSLVYYVSKVLAIAEMRYEKIEKTTLALVIPLHKLKRYFLVHPITIQMNFPLKHVL